MQARAHFHVLVLTIDVVVLVGLEALRELLEGDELIPSLFKLNLRILLQPLQAILALQDF